MLFFLAFKFSRRIFTFYLINCFIFKQSLLLHLFISFVWCACIILWNGGGYKKKYVNIEVNLLHLLLKLHLMILHVLMMHFKEWWSLRCMKKKKTLRIIIKTCWTISCGKTSNYNEGEGRKQGRERKTNEEALCCNFSFPFDDEA